MPVGDIEVRDRPEGAGDGGNGRRIGDHPELMADAVVRDEIVLGRVRDTHVEPPASIAGCAR